MDRDRGLGSELVVSKNVGLSVQLLLVSNERLPLAIEDWLTCSLLGPGFHQLFAKRLPSPFSVLVQGDEDLEFAALAAAVWGPFLPNFRFLSIAIAEQSPCGCAASGRVALRVPSAHRTAVIKNPAFIAALSALLRWPDIHQAAAYILGLPHRGRDRVLQYFDRSSRQQYLQTGKISFMVLKNLWTT